ncbi:MAG TPA: acetate--CoA ligase family protein [Chloroflexota bacterium]|nr:acetate--CoA ligase family protein [Chloroflexota bacterium]
MHRLSALFDFQSVAVVGASDTNHTGLGTYQALKALNFQGRYYPVNPRRDEVHGLKAYPSVSALPETPDMVVVAIPREGVPDVIDEAAKRGAKAAVILAAGFLEQDELGAQLQARITATARQSGLLVIGPNCLGIASLTHRTAACSMGVQGLTAGNVGVISNSGGLLNEVMSCGSGRGIGFSHLVSSGNEAGVTAADVIDFFVEDPATDVILGVLETARDPGLFVAAAERALAARKPIVIMKMGSSEKAARSTLTHTGAMAGSDAVYTALFRQKGIIRVGDLDELVDMGSLFATSIGVLRQRRLERTAVIEISGGGKGLVSDTAAAAGVDLPDLPEPVVEDLRAKLPDFIEPSNPMDSGGSWGDANKPKVYPIVLEAFASQPDFDVILSRYTVPRTGGIGPLAARLDEMEAARAAHPDRLFGILSRTSDQFSDEWAEAIRARNIPFVQGYGRGLRAIGRLAEYSRAVHGPAAPHQPSPVETGEGEGEGSHQTALSEIESKQILKEAGIAVVETVAAATREQAVAEANRLGYPVALKVISPAITHKSDSGGVRLNLADTQAVEDAFDHLMRLDGAQAVAVQRMAKPGLEVVLGAHRDAQFGAVILFGLGGIFVEVLHDVALRVAPLTEPDARSMLGDIRGRALLDGLRGQPPADRAAITQALLSLSRLMLSRPDIASIDVNPAFAYADGLLAVDARVELSA